MKMQLESILAASKLIPPGEERIANIAEPPIKPTEYVIHLLILEQRVTLK